MKRNIAHTEVGGRWLALRLLLVSLVAAASSVSLALAASISPALAASISLALAAPTEPAVKPADDIQPVGARNVQPAGAGDAQPARGNVDAANADQADEAVRDQLKAARSMYLAGKYEEAVETYSGLADQRPTDSAVGQARCYREQGKLAEAQQALEAGLKADPKHADLLAEQAQLAFDRGDYASAAEAVKAALASNEVHAQARWLRAELYRVAGKLDEANAAYKWFVDHYNEKKFHVAETLCYIGQAAAQFARWNRLSDQFNFLVNDLYPEALRQDPSCWRAHYETGLLYLEKYNQGEASKDLKAALELNPNAAEVHAALAQLALQNYALEEATRFVEQALELNPTLLPAHWYQADVHLANFQAAEAAQILEQALALNPVHEGTLGRLASAYAVVDGLQADGDPQARSQSRYGKLIDQVVARNEHAGEFFLTLGAGLDATRHFPAAARYYQEALDRMPQLVETRGVLGLMYMRLGDEIQAQKLLDESFEVDPFNVRVSNSLKVLEVLQEYAVLETEHFVVKFDRVQDEVLARMASRYLESEVYPELTRQFGFEPEGKSLFEIFHRSRNTSGHGWFSARMVGLPYIGTVGACAGKMVALASPNDMPKKYNWARVLKHEFVHVLNLQQSHFNIPHWFTEALAVQSEGLPRSQIWNELLAQRVPQNNLFNLETINLGFIRPASSLDWQMAYCQAQLYAQFMLATYGEDALAKMLQAYADNLETRAALKRSFNVEQEAFEAAYVQHLQGVVAGLAVHPQPAEMSFGDLSRAYRQDPENLDLASRLALANLNRKAYPKARELANQVLEKEPRHQLANYVLARTHLVVGQTDQALKLLEDCLDREAPQPNALALLAGLKLKAEKYDEAKELYLLGAKNEPQNSQWLKSLAGLYLKSGDQKSLGEVLVRLAELDGDDVTIRKKLAQMAMDANDLDKAIAWSNQVLAIDVLDLVAHRTLAQAHEAKQEFALAKEAYELAVLVDPKDPALRFSLAQACVKAKDTVAARRALEQLLTIAPDHPGAADLMKSLPP